MRRPMRPAPRPMVVGIKWRGDGVGFVRALGAHALLVVRGAGDPTGTVGRLSLLARRGKAAARAGVGCGVDGCGDVAGFSSSGAPGPGDGVAPGLGFWEAAFFFAQLLVLCAAIWYAVPTGSLPSSTLPLAAILHTTIGCHLTHCHRTPCHLTHCHPTRFYPTHCHPTYCH